MAGLNRRAALALAGAALAAGGSAAQPPLAWPTRSLRLILAYPTGGITDLAARELAARIERHYGITVLVEHRPGAGGTLAMEMLTRAAPDGATLCLNAATPITLAPWLGTLRYDPRRDLTPLRALMATPVLVVGTPSLPAGDWAGALARARANANGLRWASSGLGSTGHLVMEQVRIDSGLPLVHVPYKGGGQQLQDALGGHFELLSTNLAAQQVQWVREGRLKALAVSSTRRHPALHEVPTLAELGHPRASRSSVFGLFAPGGLSAERRETMHAALAEVLGAPWNRFLQAQLAEPLDDSPERFAIRLEEESAANRRLTADPRFGKS